MNVNNVIPAAEPTLYNGIEFRSRTEAIFACALHLHGAQFEYEPWWNDYFPIDFLVVKNNLSALIELKPTPQTSDAIMTWSAKINDMQPRFDASQSQSQPFDCLMVVMNFHNYDIDTRLIAARNCTLRQPLDVYYDLLPSQNIQSRAKEKVYRQLNMSAANDDDACLAQVASF